ncbi:fimbria/pilus periplasmic chaperone [Cupriavidus necator]|uniref:fimbria/pilus periplasmic chaperone n=1 Tax=Cupriavidus necator TaxID=106590 RepID=UPI0039C03B0A
MTSIPMRPMLAAVFSIGMALCAAVHASVVIGGTRVIYDAHDTEVTIKLTNEGKSPALTQVWLDTGNPNDDPSTISTPFDIVPPLARIDAGRSQTLRIIHTGAPMPADKESLFWLNVLEVPPKPRSAGGNDSQLQLAFRSRIKLFYRPRGLAGAPADAPAQVRWRLATADGAPAIEAHNPTPYHVSFTVLDLLDGKATGNTPAAQISADMVAPGEARRFPLPAGMQIQAGTRMRYHAISDYGGDVDGQVSVEAASSPAAPAPSPAPSPTPTRQREAGGSPVAVAAPLP